MNAHIHNFWPRFSLVLRGEFWKYTKETSESFFCKRLNVSWQERTTFVFIHHWSISAPNQDN